MTNGAASKVGPLTVVIGLGGNGSVIVDRFAQFLPDDSTFLIYACDTHPQSPEVRKHDQRVKFKELSRPQEIAISRMKIKVEPAHVQAVKGQGHGEGALRYRDYGRACWRYNSDNIIQEVKRDLDSRRKEKGASRLEIAIVTTLGGGTGSGCLIDLASALKEGLPSKETFVEAFVILPYGYVVKDEHGVIVDYTKNEDYKAFANAFAALLELRKVIGLPEGKGGNPFQMINLISAHSLGEWEDVDSVIGRTMIDWYTGSLAEVSNPFRDMPASKGFTTMVPAVVEFPLEMVQRYIDVYKQSLKSSSDKEIKEQELNSYVHRQGNDMTKWGKLSARISDLTAQVDFANSQLHHMKSLEEGGFALLKASRIAATKETLRKKAEDIFGTDMSIWQHKATSYQGIVANLAELVRDPEFVNKLALSNSFIVDIMNAIGSKVESRGKGRARNRSKQRGVQGNEGLLSAFMNDYTQAWQVKKEFDELQLEYDTLTAELEGLTRRLSEPEIAGTLPVDRESLRRFVEGKIDLDEYRAPMGTKTLIDILEVMLGKEAEAEQFLVDTVRRALNRLETAAEMAFHETLIKRELYKSAYGAPNGELEYRIVLAGRKENFDPATSSRVSGVDKEIRETENRLRTLFQLDKAIFRQDNEVKTANLYLAIYFVISHIDVDQFREWDTGKERYLKTTNNMQKPLETHAWELEKDFWTKENIEQFIAEIERKE